MIFSNLKHSKMSTIHVGSGSSSDAPFASGSQRPREVNESVYKFDRLLSTPTMQILFFHGLQFDDSSGSHFRNWKSRDGSVIWPEKWLLEDFRAAEILYISYDGVVKNRSPLNATVDMYITGENLMSDLTQANVGQILNCPVIMVGHCFGGIVVKQLCLQAHKLLTNPTKLRNFLDNIRGIFYYSTPHGSESFEKLADIDHPFWSYFRVLSTEGARLNYEFNRLCDSHGWQIHGLGAGLPVQSGRFKGLVVVKEPSARLGHSFTVRGADHFGICKPESKTSSGYLALKELLRSIESSIPKAVRLIHGLPAHPIGLERRSREVQVKLADAPVLGILGMGGIGKTAIAKEVYNMMFRNFEYACFTETVKEIPRILREFYRRGTRVDRNRIQWSDLEKTKTLIVLDDVDHNQIIPLPDLDFFGEGSHLIITSRYQGVLDVFANSVIHDVEFLIHDEARKLFCQHAFGEDGIPDQLIRENHHLKENVEGVVMKCGGLPLTLEVTGCYLRRHKTNAKVWKETIEKLGKAESVDGLRDDRVWSSLKVSYDGLDMDLQGMFIEAGTYFFGQPVEQALAAWSTAYGNSHSAWANLLSTCMVKEITKSKWTYVWVEYKKIWVHEHLRDLAKKLSKGSTVLRYIGRGVRMDLLNVVNSETKHLRIRTGDWVDDADDPKELTTLQLEILDKLEELKYLELQGVALEGSSTNFPKKLSLLIWKFRYETQSVPISLQGMNDLAVLELAQCGILEETIDALGTLTNLRTLSLQCIQGLHRLPDNLDDLSELNRLELSFIPDLETLPHSIGHLPDLERLDLVGLNVEVLPESFGNLSSLATLRITSCDQLRSLPESFGRLTSLTTFVLTFCKMLQFLQLSESLGEKCRPAELADSFGSLSSLKYLRLSYCPRLESLPPSFGMLESLEDIELDNLEKLDRLPENFGDLKALKRLVITEAKFLETLPDSFGNLSALTYLRLQGCDHLERLPASFGNLSSLEELALICCERLHRLPPNVFGHLEALKTLKLLECNHLEALPDSLGNLSSLTRLYIKGAGLRSLPTSIGKLRSLRTLMIVGSSLNSIPDELGNLPSLEILFLESCNRIETIPDGLRRIFSLRQVILHCCSTLEKIPGSWGEDFAPNEDRSIQTRRTDRGRSSHNASAERIRLCVCWCSLLDDSVLERLGWIETDSQEFGLEDEDVRGYTGLDWIQGTWYQRKGPGERAVPLIHSAEVNLE